MSEDNKLFEQRFDINDEQNASKRYALRETLASIMNQEWKIDFSVIMNRLLEYENKGYSITQAIDNLDKLYEGRRKLYSEQEPFEKVHAIDKAERIIEVLQEENII